MTAVEAAVGGGIAGLRTVTVLIPILWVFSRLAISNGFCNTRCMGAAVTPLQLAFITTASKLALSQGWETV